MKRILPLLALLALSARAAVVPGLEAYGDLTLVDEVNCATDTSHEFHEHESGASSVQTILGSPCRVLPHPAANAGFFSYRLGKGKGLVAHDMYLLVVEYPDDVPRTANLLNRAMNSRNGWHTGNSVGDTLVAHIVGMTHPESLDVPLSGQYKQLEQVMFLNEKVFPYDTTDSYIDAVQNGFDVIVHVFEQGDALDSAGAAVRAIKLYHVNDESAIRATIKYPTGDVPRRHVTWRDEMGKHNLYTCNDDPFDNLRMKMRLMKALGIDTWSRDLFEFGYNIFWDVSYDNNGHSDWMWPGDHPDYWGREMAIYREAGIYLLPFYEYSGARRSGGFGVDGNAEHKCTPMDRGGYGGHYNLFVSNANGASNANIDLTSQDAYTEFKAVLNCTILRYKDQANFIGAWIRNRGSLPVSFSETTRNRFCADTGRASGSVTIEALTNKSSDSEYWRHICKMNQFPALYKEYRTWWYGKRRDWLVAMQDYLENGGLAGAKVYYCGESAEAGPSPHNLAYYDNYYDFLPRENSAWDSCGYSGTKTTIEQGAEIYETYGLRTDSMTWYPDEYNHACPRNDCETYTNVSDVALCYPYNCVYTTLPSLAADYRNGSGDLFFSRHFCLYEGCGNGVGYFTTEMDRVGRAIMLPELHAMAHQDPTLIGFMQGGHLARNSTKEFREFNENFLSLPAIKGTLVRGGSWSDAVTIRKYSTPAATYYAAINTSGTAQTATCAVPEGPLFATVTGAALPVSGGTATFSLEPYQMLCYTTENPGGTTASAAVSDVTDTTATLAVTVSSLASSSATISVRYSKNENMSGATSLSAVSVSAAGTKTFSLSSLSPSTTYYVQVVVDDGTGSPITLSKTFTTAADASLPSGSVSLGTVGPNSAQIAVALASFGRNASRADIRVEYSSAPFGARTKTFSGVSSLSSTQLLDGLSTKVAYTASVYAKNNLGKETLLGTLSFTTAARPTGGAAHPDWLPGLWQHKYGCTKSAYPDFTVGAAGYDDSDRVPGTIMADVSGQPGPEVTNPFSGKKYQWASNTTFSYEGEMFFRGGTTYDFFHCVDDGVAIELDGESFTRQSAGNVSGYNAGVTLASKSYDADGWHPIKVWVYDWDGGKGYVSSKIGFSKTGLGWNTNGCTTVNADNEANWSILSDPGDGSLLRVSAGAAYVALDGELSLSGTTLSAPLRYWSYDEDDVLSLYWSKSEPANPRAVSSWTGSTAVSPLSFPGEKTATGSIANLSVSPGETVYVVARLSNSRAGYESWSEVGEFSVAPVLPPAATLAVGTVGYTDAAFTVNVTSFGTDAASASVLVEVLSGSTVVWTQTKTANATGAVPFSATGLSAGTSYTVRATVTSTAGSVSLGPTAFSTTAYGAPVFGTCSATNVGTGSATLSIALSDLGAGSASATVAWSLSPSTATPASGTLSFGATGAKTVSVTGLAAGTTYTATLVATGANGTTASKTFTFRTADLVPPAATLAVGTVGYTDAAFTVNVTSFGTDAASASVLVEVLSGSTVVWTQTKTANATGAVPFSATGLSAGTSYTVRATVTSTAGSVSLGPTAFSTTAYGAPVFGTCSATNVGTGSATLSIALSDLGAGSASATVAWSLSPSTATPASGTLSFGATGAKTVSVTGLAAGTTYTATLVATGANGTTASKTFTFRTADLVPPAATLAVGTVGYTDAAFTVNVTSFGTDAASASVLVEVLSGSTVVWTQTKTANATGAVPFSATGLSAGTSYTVRATVTSTAGSVSLGPTAFSTTAYGAPVFGTCSATNVGTGSATLSIALSDLGAGSASATVAWSLSPSTATPASGTLSFGATGAKTVSVTGLAAGTTYTATLVATGANGATATSSFSFATLRFPLALGDPAGVCNGAGTEATAKVAVTRADVAATLVLSVDGVAAKTWTSVSAGTEYSFSFPIEVGQTKAFEFVLSATGYDPVSKTGSVTGRMVVDWFNVPLDDPAYENWTLATGPDAYDATAGWTLPDGDAGSAIVPDGAGGRVLSFAPPEGGSVSYEPGSPSEDGRTLEVSGTAKLPAREGVPSTPAGTPLAGIALGSANGADALYGYARDGWTALSGAAVAADSAFAWKAVVDFANGTVAYYANGTRLAAAAGGATALPLASTATHATRVAFLGRPRIGSFRGVYAEAGGGAIRLWEAAIRVDGTGLLFTTVGNAEKFVIGLKEARAGAWYAAFAANSLDTPADEWVCVACSDAPATGGENVDLPCATADEQGRPIPSRFFKIYAVGEPIAAGTSWGDYDFVAGE